MANIRESRRLTILLRTAELALVGLLAGFLGFQWWKAAHWPLGPAPQYELPKAEMTQSERERFLDGDFTIVKDMKALPRPVLRVFTEEGGSRLLMANPGKDFNPSDVIYDESIPGKRMILAGVAEDKCFILCEQGGVAHMYILAFYTLTSKDTTQPLWRGFCEPAANLQDLRFRVRNGQCSEPVPQGMLH